jgi:hypothetical protein
MKLPSLLLSAFFAFQSAALNPSDLERVNTGTIAPDFALPDGDGKTHRLKDYLRTPVLVVFYRGHW